MRAGETRRRATAGGRGPASADRACLGSVFVEPPGVREQYRDQVPAGKGSEAAPAGSLLVETVESVGKTLAAMDQNRHRMPRMTLHQDRGRVVSGDAQDVRGEREEL